MHKGSIKLLAQGGTVNVSGKLDASAPKGGDGGSIETSGNKVHVADTAVITTEATLGNSGTWLIDPTDFNIVAGSGALTTSGIGAGTLIASLGTGNVSITTAATGTQNGDINVNAKVEWSANTTLALNAANNININAPIIAHGPSAGLVLNYGGWNGTTVTTAVAGTNYNIRTKASYSGVADAPGPIYDKNGHPVYQMNLDANNNLVQGNQVTGPVAKQDTSGGVYGSVTFDNASNANGLTINGQNYTLIHSLSQLDALDGVNAVDGSGTPNNVSGNFALAQSFNAGGTTYTRALLGFADLGASPIVNYSFGGTLAGLGNTISNLTINAPTQRPVGLIAISATGTTIRDIGLENANITASGTTGTLLGRGTSATTVSNVYATGSVTATGLNPAGTSVVPGNGSNAGGLIGQLQGSGNSVTDAFANVPVLGFANSGGLIGSAAAATISRSHATGNITLVRTSTGIGGLIGTVSNSTVSFSYATGNVTGSGNSFGGLLGQTTGGSLTNSFATGNVDAGSVTSVSTGGLVGQTSGTATITNVYAIGTVNGNGDVGGLIGRFRARSRSAKPSQPGK